MLTQPIDETLLNTLGRNNYSRLKKVLTNHKMERLRYFLGKSKDFYRKHHLLSLKNVVEFTKGKTRRNGEDDLSHHINVALKDLRKKTYYDIDDALMFNIKLDHDIIENKVEDEISEDDSFSFLLETLNQYYGAFSDASEANLTKSEIDNLKIAIKQTESIFKKAIVGVREDLFKKYEEEHQAIKGESINTDTYKQFNDDLIKGVRAMTRYAVSDDNYGQYMLRLYPSDVNKILIYVPPVKWADVAHNQQTLWSKEIIKEFGLTLEELSDKEQYLIEIFRHDMSKYNKEKKIFGKKYNEIIESGGDNSLWRMKSIEKAIIHIYMGKSFMKGHRNKVFYSEYIKPAFKRLIRNAYSQASRERMFMMIYNSNITIPIKSTIENEWIKYIQKGLDLVEVSASKEHFKGTISEVISEMMKGEMMGRFFDKKTKLISDEEMYERVLIYESTLQQNLRRVNLIKDLNIKSVDDLIKMRTSNFYKRNVRREIKVDYMLRNLPELINRFTIA